MRSIRTIRKVFLISLGGNRNDPAIAVSPLFSESLMPNKQINSLPRVKCAAESLFAPRFFE